MEEIEVGARRSRRSGKPERPALSATRALDVISFLSANPKESFSMAEIIRRLGINNASAHAVLRALSDSGYVVRDPSRRTYALGPAVVAAGTAALESNQAIDEARDVMRQLADELQIELTLSAVAGDEIIIIARAGPLGLHGMSAHAGQRIPFRAPLGSVFVAWEGPDEIEHWLRQTGDAAATEAQREYLTSIRKLGCLIGLRVDAHRRLMQIMEELGAWPHNQELQEVISSEVDNLLRSKWQLDVVDSASQYELISISAPIFDKNGSVSLMMSVYGLFHTMSGSELLTYATKLRDATRGVTIRTHGRFPRDY